MSGYIYSNRSGSRLIRDRSIQLYIVIYGVFFGLLVCAGLPIGESGAAQCRQQCEQVGASPQLVRTRSHRGLYPVVGESVVVI